MSLLLAPGVLVLLALVLWGLTKLEDGLPREPDTHQRPINDHTIYFKDIP